MGAKEMLVMFPNVPAESLFWDFIDVVGNETAPKSIYLGVLAAITVAPRPWSMMRPTVSMQLSDLNLLRSSRHALGFNLLEAAEHAITKQPQRHTK